MYFEVTKNICIQEIDLLRKQLRSLTPSSSLSSLNISNLDSSITSNVSTPAYQKYRNWKDER